MPAFTSSVLVRSPTVLRSSLSALQIPRSHLPISTHFRSFNAQAGPSTARIVSAASTSSRSFSFTPHRYDSTTALNTEVKKREENDGEEVVGGSGKGVEGPHFQGRLE